jgi:hypothetical protein
MAAPDMNDANPSIGGTSTDSSQHTTGVVSRVRERASAQLSSQKDKATDSLGAVGQAVRQSTQQLRDQRHDTLAEYLDQAATQIERLAGRLREKDLGELFDDAQRLARRQPGLFIASAFTIGLVGARFFKSSPPDSGQSRSAGSFGYGGRTQPAGGYGTQSGAREYGTGMGGRARTPDLSTGQVHDRGYPAGTGSRSTAASTRDDAGAGTGVEPTAETPSRTGTSTTGRTGGSGGAGRSRRSSSESERS